MVKWIFYNDSQDIGKQLHFESLTSFITSKIQRVLLTRGETFRNIIFEC